MSDLPDEVLNRAVNTGTEAAAKALSLRWQPWEFGDTSMRKVAEVPAKAAVEAAARVLIEAERERIKARIKELSTRYDDLGKQEADTVLSVIDEEGRESE